MTKPIDERELAVPPPGPASPDTVTRDLETAMSAEIDRLVQTRAADGRGRRSAYVDVIRLLKEIR